MKKKTLKINTLLIFLFLFRPTKIQLTYPKCLSQRININDISYKTLGTSIILFKLNDLQYIMKINDLNCYIIENYFIINDIAKEFIQTSRTVEPIWFSFTM